MPKVENTRKQRAEKLLAQLQVGPTFSNPAMFGGGPLTTAETTVQYRRWAETWILPELISLVPELRAEGK